MANSLQTSIDSLAASLKKFGSGVVDRLEGKSSVSGAAPQYTSDTTLASITKSLSTLVRPLRGFSDEILKSFDTIRRSRTAADIASKASTPRDAANFARIANISRSDRQYIEELASKAMSSDEERKSRRADYFSHLRTSRNLEQKSRDAGAAYTQKVVEERRRNLEAHRANLELGAARQSLFTARGVYAANPTSKQAWDDVVRAQKVFDKKQKSYSRTQHNLSKASAAVTSAASKHSNLLKQKNISNKATAKARAAAVRAKKTSQGLKSSLGSTVQRAAKSSNIRGFIGSALSASNAYVAVAQAAFQVVSSLNRLSESAMNSDRELAAFNGRIAQAMATLSVHDIRRDISRAKYMEKSTEDLVKSYDKTKNLWFEFDTSLGNASNRLSTFTSDISGRIGAKAGGAMTSVDRILAVAASGFGSQKGENMKDVIANAILNAFVATKIGVSFDTASKWLEKIAGMLERWAGKAPPDKIESPEIMGDDLPALEFMRGMTLGIGMDAGSVDDPWTKKMRKARKDYSK